MKEVDNYITLVNSYTQSDSSQYDSYPLHTVINSLGNEYYNYNNIIFMTQTPAIYSDADDLTKKVMKDIEVAAARLNEYSKSYKLPDEIDELRNRALNDLKVDPLGVICANEGRQTFNFLAYAVARRATTFRQNF